MGIAYVAGDTLEVGIARHKGLEDHVLFLVAWVQRDSVLPVPLTVVVFVQPQVVGLNAQQDIHIGQTLGAEVPGLLPAPQSGAEVAVKADRHAFAPGDLEAVQDELGTGGAECGGDAAEMEPVKALQQCVQIYLGEIVFCDGAVLAVIGDLAGADAVARLQVVGAKPVGGGFLRSRENHRGAMDVVAAQHAHCAFAQAVVGHHAEKGGVHAKVGQREGDVGLAAAVAGFESGGHPDLLIVGRGQAEHDLTDGNEFAGTVTVSKQRIAVFHRYLRKIHKKWPWGRAFYAQPQGKDKKE